MESVVDLVRASAFPPATGRLNALKMPLSLEETRILFPSAENDAPLTVVVAVNCSIEYCFNGRWLPGDFSWLPWLRQNQRSGLPG